jgi:hypothetical protein
MTTRRLEAVIKKASLANMQSEKSVGLEPIQPWRRWGVHIAAIFFWLLSSYASIQAQKLSFVWLSVASIITLVLLCLNTRSSVTRVVLINLGAAVMALDCVNFIYGKPRRIRPTPIAAITPI